MIALCPVTGRGFCGTQALLEVVTLSIGTCHSRARQRAMFGTFCDCNRHKAFRERVDGELGAVKADQRTMPMSSRAGAGSSARVGRAPADPLMSIDLEMSPGLGGDVRVIGVGGAGGNAVNRMIEAGVTGVRFIAVNTDTQALGRCEAPVRLHLGKPGSARDGAGGNPEVGMRAAESVIEDIDALVAGADMVFITAGMGGGTGTGASGVIGQRAKAAGALTVGVVSLPFTFEGMRRRKLAEEGVDSLREVVDALIVVPNDRLLDLDHRVKLTDGFKVADDMLRHGVQGISDLVTITGLINLDFADVRSVMTNAGTAVMAIGEGQGPNRTSQAVDSIISNPLLETSITGASSVLLNITGPADIPLHEVMEICDRIKGVCASDVNFFFGAVVHAGLVPELRVTLIATGMPTVGMTASRDRFGRRAPTTTTRQSTNDRGLTQERTGPVREEHGRTRGIGWGVDGDETIVQPIVPVRGAFGQSLATDLDDEVAVESAGLAPSWDEQRAGDTRRRIAFPDPGAVYLPEETSIDSLPPFLRRTRDKGRPSS